MLKTEWLSDHGVLVVEPQGKLAADDFTMLAGELDPFLEEQGRLNGLLITAEHFPGWDDFAALLSHRRFIKAHHRKINKVAAVTDSGFLSILPGVASHFIHAEVKYFPFHEKSSAIKWLLQK